MVRWAIGPVRHSKLSIARSTTNSSGDDLVGRLPESAVLIRCPTHAERTAGFGKATFLAEPQRLAQSRQPGGGREKVGRADVGHRRWSKKTAKAKNAWGGRMEVRGENDAFVPFSSVPAAKDDG